MKDIRKVLQTNGVTLSKFADTLRISRPTLNNYISIFEKGGEIPKDKYQIIFLRLFNDTLSKKEFNSILDDFSKLIERDSMMGVMELEPEETDLFTSILDSIKNDFKSENYSEDIYKFLNLLVSSYKTEPFFNHIARYFLILNGQIDYKKIDLQKESYLLYYFKLFSYEKENVYFKYDKIVAREFIKRIEELRKKRDSQEVEIEKKIRNMIINEMTQLQNLGIKMTNEEMVDYLKKKILMKK